MHTRKSNWIILIISWAILGFFAHGYYFNYSYNRDFALVLLSTMALSVPLFIFAPGSENKSWPLIYRLPLTLGAAIGAVTSAAGLNPCSNGCDDEPVIMAWCAWFLGLAFLNRRNLSWKYWLFLWGLIHVFSMDREMHLWMGGWSGASDIQRLQWRAEFYLIIFAMGCVVLSLFCPKFRQNNQFPASNTQS
jgi:hypothetical protein